MQLMTLLGFRRNISYFKAPVRCIGRLLFAGRHTNMFLLDDCKNIERLLRSVVHPHPSQEETRTLWPKVLRQMFALMQNFARSYLYGGGQGFICSNMIFVDIILAYFCAK